METNPATDIEIPPGTPDISSRFRTAPTIDPGPTCSQFQTCGGGAGEVERLISSSNYTYYSGQSIFTWYDIGIGIDTKQAEVMPQDAGADEALARMGYQSELPRNLSMLSVLGL